MHPLKEFLAVVGFFTLIAAAIILCAFAAKGAGILT